MSETPDSTPEATPGAAPVTGAAPRADCTIDADGRTVFVLRTPPAAVAGDAPRLLLRLRPAKGRPAAAEIPVGLAPEPGGALRGVLGARPALAEGRWDVYLLTGTAAPPLRLRPGLRDQRALVDGYTRDWPSPVAVRVPYTTVDGFLALRAWLRTAHAEVEAIGTADRSMRVGARLHGASPAGRDDVTVVLRRRDATRPEREVRARVGSDGRRFSFTVDYGELASGSPGGGAVWDVFVRAGDAARVRVARLLDDVADRKEVVVHPAAVVDGVRVRPYYTVDNDLAVEVGAAVRP
ncbi:MAG TPA: transferase [Streptomyces sp.]|nr:transferase [Streptomyces sp.]